MADVTFTVDVRTGSEKLVRHMRHPVKNGLLTLAAEEDCDIPDLTATFLMGGAGIDRTEIPNSD